MIKVRASDIIFWEVKGVVKASINIELNGLAFDPCAKDSAERREAFRLALKEALDKWEFEY